MRYLMSTEFHCMYNVYLYIYYDIIFLLIELSHPTQELLFLGHIIIVDGCVGTCTGDH